MPRCSSALVCYVLANSFPLQVGMQRTTGTVKPAVAFDYIPWRCTRWISFITGVLHILDQLVCVGGRNKEGEYPNMACLAEAKEKLSKKDEKM